MEGGNIMKKIVCDRCGDINKFGYKTFLYEYKEGKKKLVTWCEDCLGTRVSSGKTSQQLLEHISTPYWKHLGLKPKPKEIAFEKYLKSKGMTYGDHRRLQATKATIPSVLPEFNKHIKGK